MPRGGDPASPEDHLEGGDSLSNWGSEKGNGVQRESAGNNYNVAPNGDRRAERQRRMSAPSSRGGPGPLAGASSRANRAAVTAASKARDGSSAARGAADAREVTTSSGKQKPAKGGVVNGGSNQSGAAGVDHERPAWNASTKPTTSKGRRLSQGEQQAHGRGAAGAASDEVCVGGGLVGSGVGRLLPNANRRKAKRSSVGSGDSGGGVMVGACAADSPSLGDDAEVYGGRGGGGGGGGGAIAGEDVDDLDSAAPSQEEIRVMIERIKLQTAADDAAAVSGSQKVAKPGSARSDLEVNTRTTAIRGNASTQHRRAASSAAVMRGNGGVSGGAAGGGEGGALGMVEIEEEERRLKQQASKLQLEMSALKRRRLEVRLVKVEQQLKEEAVSRLIQRESKVQAAVERACEALRKERRDRVNSIAAVKEGLRSKLDQLSSMYEEVSARLETLEEAYDNAEGELRERANADQQKAVQREDRNVRRRIKAIVAEHGPERTAERIAARQEGQRSANATTATQDKERPTAQSVDHPADRSPSTRPAKELSSASDAVTASLVRGRTRAPAVGADAEVSQEHSENVMNGSDRPRRRSVGATRSVVASRRKRRTSVDALAPPQL